MQKEVVGRVILSQSRESVRIISALFVACSSMLKLVYDRFLPGFIEPDAARWGINIAVGVFFVSTFLVKNTSNRFYATSLLIYLVALIYSIYLCWLNALSLEAVFLLILVTTVGTVIINNSTFYFIQGVVVSLAGIVIYFLNPLAQQLSIVALLNLVVSQIVCTIIMVTRMSLRSKVEYSYQLLSDAQMITITADKKGKIIFASPTIKDTLGYEPTELLGDGWWKNLGLANGWISREHIEMHPNLISSEMKSFEKMVLTKEGKKAWVKWTNAVLPEGSYVGIGVDVTRYKMGGSVV